MTKRYLVCAAVCALAFLPAIAYANAMLVSVVPVGSGCVDGPKGNFVQIWDVELGQTYTLTITNVLECGNGGTDPTINVKVKSEGTDNWDLVAYLVSPGVYAFDFTVPEDGACTYPIWYCTTPGVPQNGLFVFRNDGAPFQAHLRAASFEPGCTNPTPILGPECGAVPNEDSAWGRIKAMYD